MSTLEKAIEIAARAHAGQYDKAGEPYILHPLRVLLSLKTADEQMAAALHDVVEDTPMTFEDLEAEGFSSAVINALRALTKEPGETRMPAARRAAQDAVAVRVKIADVTDNMNLARIPNPTAKDRARLEEYKQVKAHLESSLRK